MGSDSSRCDPVRPWYPPCGPRMTVECQGKQRHLGCRAEAHCEGRWPTVRYPTSWNRAIPRHHRDSVQTIMRIDADWHRWKRCHAARRVQLTCEGFVRPRVRGRRRASVHASQRRDAGSLNAITRSERPENPRKTPPVATTTTYCVPLTAYTDGIVDPAAGS